MQNNGRRLEMGSSYIEESHKGWKEEEEKVELFWWYTKQKNFLLKEMGT